jgi:hypothetical protein
MVGVPEEERGFMVLLEEVRGDVKLLIDYYLQLDQKIDRVARESLERDQALDRKIDLHSATLMNRMDQGFAAVMKEIRTLTQRFDAHERAHAS